MYILWLWAICLIVYVVAIFKKNWKLMWISAGSSLVLPLIDVLIKIL